MLARFRRVRVTAPVLALLTIALPGARPDFEAGSPHLAARDFFVAVDGDDEAAGTRAQPFRTLERARSAVRKTLTSDDRRDETVGAVTVWIRGGDYTLTRSFALGPEDSGRPDARVTYRAYDTEEVRILGGLVLPPESAIAIAAMPIRRMRLDASAAENVITFDLPALGVTDFGDMVQFGHGQPVNPAPLELFVDRRPMTLARYPNEGDMAIGRVLDAGSIPRVGDYSNRGATFEYTDERHARWADLDDVWLQGTFMWGYADDMIPVASIDAEARQVKLAAPHMYGVGTGEPYRKYYALNILSELDSAGEWYLDRATGLLYVWPPDVSGKNNVADREMTDRPIGGVVNRRLDNSPASSVKTDEHALNRQSREFVVSMLREPLVRLDNASYITIRDLTVEYGRGMGVYIEGGEGNELAGLTIRNVGTIGILMGKGARQTTVGITHEDYEGEEESGEIGSLLSHYYHNTAWNRNAGRKHTVRSCDVYNTGAGGIFISGGDRVTLTPGGSLAENNRMWNNQRRNRFLWAGLIVDGVGNRAAHNEIFGSDFQAIMVSGNEHVFEYNHVHDIGMDSDDTSPWYTGRDPSGRGHIVRYNYFHDIGRPDRMGMGVYLDDGTSGVKVFGNIFDRVASYGTVYSNSGSDNVIENNIFMNGFGPALHIKSMWFTWARGLIGQYFDKDGIYRNRLSGAIDITKPPYSERYPELVDFFEELPAPTPTTDSTVAPAQLEDDPTGAHTQPIETLPVQTMYRGMLPRRNAFRRNVIVNYGEVLRLDHPNIGLDVNDNWQTSGDPGFVDMEGGDFTIAENAEIFEHIPGFVPIPYSRIGTYEDEYLPRRNYQR